MFFLEPLDQFELVFLGYFKQIPINNSTLYMIFSYIIIRFFFGLTFFNLKLIPNNWQQFFESYYLFALSMIKDQIGRSGLMYFPLIFTIFTTILISNLLGMTLYSFTITSHAVITFGLSFALFMGIIIIGLIKQKINFIYTFIPSGAPKALLPFLVIIEIISYFSRPISLAIRLFANMMSGHALLVILGGFTFNISKKHLIISLIPFLLITVIVGLELMIAILQAYVFAVLICIYINDSIHGAH